MPNDQNDSRKVMTFKEAPPWLRHSTLKCYTLFSRIPSKHPTLYDVIIWLVLGWLVNNQKLTLVQRHYLIRIQHYNLTLIQRQIIMLYSNQIMTLHQR